VHDQEKHLLADELLEIPQVNRTITDLRRDIDGVLAVKNGICGDVCDGQQTALIGAGSSDI
jgi:hypothetical protein